MFGLNTGTQGILDLGTAEQKAKLFDIRELVSTPAGVSMAPTTPDRWKIYPKRNQMDQDACVFHARAKAGGILQEQQNGEFVEYSAADYNKRSNAPAAGAMPIEAFDLWLRDGIGLEALEPSNDVAAAVLYARRQTEFEKRASAISLLDGYYGLVAYNFDLIVSTLHATKKPIPLGFFGTYSEWNRDTPRMENAALTLDKAVVRHEVCATPNYGIYNGEEGFTIEDSWGSAGIAGTGARWITRAWFEHRNYIPGLVPASFKNFSDLGINPAKPKIKITKTLKYGMTDPEVSMLQQVFKYEDLFPANHAGSDYFGDITLRCLKEFQTGHGIVSNGTPETTGFGQVGPETRAFINKTYK